MNHPQEVREEKISIVNFVSVVWFGGPKFFLPTPEPVRGLSREQIGDLNYRALIGPCGMGGPIPSPTSKTGSILLVLISASYSPEAV